MSRIGRKPIDVPNGVTITQADGNTLSIKGPRGTLTQAFHPDMIISREDGSLSVQRPDDEGFHRSLHGLTRTLVNNMVVGVTTGYAKTLEINGVGYRAAKDGQAVVLTLGFSHPV